MKITQVINTPDFKDENGKWVQTYSPRPYVRHSTRAGGLWNSMNHRCKPKGSFQTKHPTYISTTNGFKDFQEFAEWCQHQYGYMNRENGGRFWQLDKDLKLFGNKIYSIETSIFVPSRINSLLLNRGSLRGLCPIGVSWDTSKGKGKFKSQCSDGAGKQKNLGYFDCELLAHQAWQRYKVDLIRRIVVEDEEIRNHLELVPILLAQAQRIEDDLRNNIETK